MRINVVVAKSENDVIGRDGDLPWRLSADLRRFKQVTMGFPLVMGRRTYESIGRPLPGRTNIVVTRDRGYSATGCTIVHSLDDAIEVATPSAELMIIGGASLYREALPVAGRIFLTEVHASIAGDTVFPATEPGHWRECSRERRRADERNEHDFSFVVLKRNA